MLRKRNLLTLLLVSVCFYTEPVFAQLVGGQISLRGGNLSTIEFACLGNCSLNSSNFCPNIIYNLQTASGGSGHYRYKWETDSGTGWVPFVSVDSPFLYGVPQPQIQYKEYKYRRKVIDTISNAVTFSNSVTLQAYLTDPGSLVFGQQGTTGWYAVNIGQTPPYIKSQGSFTNAPFTYYNIIERHASTGGGATHYTQGSSAIYQPSTSLVPDTFYFKGYIEEFCSGVKFTSEIALYFIEPISAGSITANPSAACANTIIRLTGPRIATTQAYNCYWEYSNDSTNWTRAISGFTDTTFVDSTYPGKRFYRRVVTDFSYTSYSKSVKVELLDFVTQFPSGSRQWKNYCFAGTNLLLTGLKCAGLYTSDSTNIDTFNDWAPNLTPSSALNYQGCPVVPNNYTLSSRRKGFVPGRYQMGLLSSNGSVRVLRNGGFYTSAACCQSQPHMYNIGSFDTTTSIDIRYLPSSQDQSLKVKFVHIQNSAAPFEDTVCRMFGVTPVAGNQLIDIIDSSGNMFCSINPNNGGFGGMRLSVKQSPPGANNIPMDTSGRHFMPRHFRLVPQYTFNSFSGPVTIRFYFLNSELDDYRAATGNYNLQVNNLRVLNYAGPNEDCLFDNNLSIDTVLLPVDSGRLGSDGFYIDVRARRFGEFGVYGEASTLSAQHVSLSAAQVSRKILLQWKAAQHQQGDVFTILRSTDGANFEAIGRVNSKSQQNGDISYEYVDIPTSESKSLYYMVRQQSKDNKVLFSNLVKVKYGNESRVHIRPNPATDETIIQSSDKMTGVIVMDVFGRVVRRMGLSGYIMNISLSSLPRGVYSVRVFIGNEEKVLKLLKQ